MVTNYIIVLICSLFSFACALLKQLYDAQYYPKNMYVFMIDVALSGLSGVVLGFILSEMIKNELVIIGLSGLGGMFGVTALKTLMKLQLGKKINIQLSFDDEEDEHTKIKHNYVCEKNQTDDHYDCVRQEDEENKPHSHIKIVKDTKESG